MRGDAFVDPLDVAVYQTIVFTANSFGAGLKAGVPAKLFLKPFSDRNVHYVIAISPPEIPSQVSISVTATDGGAPVRVTPIGSSIGIQAVVTAQNGLADLIDPQNRGGNRR